MLASATGLAGWAYLLTVFLHVLCVIAGFGGVMLNGIWGARLSRTTGDAAGVLATSLAQVSKVAEYFIYAVPVFGIVAIVLSDKAHKFASPWVSASFALYIVGIGLSHGLLMPAVRKLVGFAEAGNVESAERAATEKRVAAVSGALHLVLALVLLLMVFGPTTSWLVAK